MSDTQRTLDDFTDCSDDVESRVTDLDDRVDTLTEIVESYGEQLHRVVDLVDPDAGTGGERDRDGQNATDDTLRMFQ